MSAVLFLARAMCEVVLCSCHVLISYPADLGYGRKFGHGVMYYAQPDDINSSIDGRRIQFIEHVASGNISINQSVMSNSKCIDLAPVEDQFWVEVSWTILEMFDDYISDRRFRLLVFAADGVPKNCLLRLPCPFVGGAVEEKYKYLHMEIDERAMQLRLCERVPVEQIQRVLNLYFHFFGLSASSVGSSTWKNHYMFGTLKCVMQKMGGRRVTEVNLGEIDLYSIPVLNVGCTYTFTEERLKIKFFYSKFSFIVFYTCGEYRISANSEFEFDIMYKIFAQMVLFYYYANRDIPRTPTFGRPYLRGSVSDRVLLRRDRRKKAVCARM